MKTRLILAIVFLNSTLTSAPIRAMDQFLDRTPTIRASHCSYDVRKITHRFDAMDAIEYKNAITHYGEDLLLKSAFQMKLSIRTMMEQMSNNNELSQDCANHLREAFRAIRTFEDVVEEHQVRVNPSRASSSSFIKNTQAKINPNYDQFDMNQDLESGDILLTRGNAFTSAAIASLGEFDTQFSHMSLVYKDPQTKVISTVEAHIEIGVVAKQLQAHIDENNMRMVVFRPMGEHKVVAQKAAEFMFKKALLASQTKGNIPYDFGMTMEDSKELFCSEVVSLGFDSVSNGKFQIPMFKSRMLTRKVEFVKDLGIEVEESFVPADLEIDPRFELVLEWRDATRLNDSMTKDAVLRTMYDLIEEGYSLRKRAGKNAFIYRNIAYPLRRIPGLNKSLIEKFPLNMSRSLIGLFAVLDDVGGYMKEVVDAKNNETISKRDIPLLELEKKAIIRDYVEGEMAKRKSKLRKRFRLQ